MTKKRIERVLKLIYYYKVIADVSSYLESPTLISPSTSVNSSQGIAESVVAKLPPINLPSLEENYIEWVNFKNTFDSMIQERNDLTNIQKFHYLKSSVKGEAQKLIVHLAITHDNYITAYNLLESRFENKRIIVQEHVNTIINLPQVTKESPASLRQLLDGLSTNLSKYIEKFRYSSTKLGYHSHSINVVTIKL
jgi:hypothetical protein